MLGRVCQQDPGQRYFVYVPGSGGEDARLLVAVHGTSRNSEEHAYSFAPYCEEFGVVLVAPHFAEGRARDYQRLGGSGCGPRADVVLDGILEETACLTGAATARFYLFGRSGGGQFAHRYTMAHPHRVAGAVIAAAGWYTFPDPRRRFPYGIRRSRDLPDVRFDAEEFLRVPITVIVGEEDTGSAELRRSKRAREQGETRVERARNWVAAMRAAARAHHLDPLVSYESIPGGDHSFTQLMQSGRLGDRVFSALFGAPCTPAAGADHG